MPKQEFNAALTGIATYFDLRRQGKAEEAERQRQRNLSMFDVASRAMGMGTQMEQLRLSRLAGQRAEQLLPSQIRTAEAGARLSEAQASGLELSQERQKEVLAAVDGFLKEQGLTQLPADAIPLVLDAVRGVADVSQVQEAIRLGAPEAKGAIEAGEAAERVEALGIRRETREVREEALRAAATRKAEKVEADARIAEAGLRQTLATAREEFAPLTAKFEKRVQSAEAKSAILAYRKAGDDAAALKTAREQYQKEFGRDMLVDIHRAKVDALIAKGRAGPTRDEIGDNIMAAYRLVKDIEKPDPVSGALAFWYAKEAGEDVNAQKQTPAGIVALKADIAAYIKVQKGMWFEQTGQYWDDSAALGIKPPPPPQLERLGSPGGRLREQERLDTKGLPAPAPTGPRPPTPEEEAEGRRRMREFRQKRGNR